MVVFIGRNPNLFWTKSGLRNLNAPPRRRSLRSLFRKKVFFAIFYFARARFFLLKGKENFFAGLCSERAGRRGFASARARRNSPHTPFPPRPRFGRRRNLRLCTLILPVYRKFHHYKKQPVNNQQTSFFFERVRPVFKNLNNINEAPTINMPVI